jgi:hypothetical protein
MKHIIPFVLLTSLAAPSLAFGAAQPKSLGVFQKWTAATYGSGSSEACYAFSQAPVPKGGKGQPAMLTVTERPGNPTEISLSQGVTYAKDAKPFVMVGTQKLAFFTKNDMAYALHSDATTKAFAGGTDAVATSPGPNGKTVTDTFSLKGYSDAFKAIDKACAHPDEKATAKKSAAKASRKKK